MKLSELSTASKVNVTAMVTAIVAIAVQIAAGVDYPAIPPGPIMLAIAVALVVFSRSRWALLVAVIIPLFLTVGGTLASVVKDDVALRNPDDLVPFLATVLQMAAVIVAFIAGIQALRQHRAESLSGAGRAHRTP